MINYNITTGKHLLVEFNNNNSKSTKMEKFRRCLTDCVFVADFHSAAEYPRRDVSPYVMTRGFEIRVARTSALSVER